MARTKVDDDPKKHGSCVASKAAGSIYGVSKYSGLVIVKASNNLLDIEYAFGLAYDDIVAQGRQESSVILFAKSSIETYDPFHPDWLSLPPEWVSIRELLELLSSKGINVVVSTGNEGRTRHMP